MKNENRLLNFLNKYQNKTEWLKVFHEWERKKFKKVFPIHYHDEQFNNFKLYESIKYTHLSFTISGCLLNYHNNNPNKHIILNNIDTYILYSYNNKDYTFNDIFKIFDNRLKIISP